MAVALLIGYRILLHENSRLFDHTIMVYAINSMQCSLYPSLILMFNDPREWLSQPWFTSSWSMNWGERSPKAMLRSCLVEQAYTRLYKHPIAGRLPIIITLLETSRTLPRYWYSFCFHWSSNLGGSVADSVSRSVTSWVFKNAMVISLISLISYNSLATMVPRLYPWLCSHWAPGLLPSQPPGSSPILRTSRARCITWRPWVMLQVNSGW